MSFHERSFRGAISICLACVACQQTERFCCTNTASSNSTQQLSVRPVGSRPCFSARPHLSRLSPHTFAIHHHTPGKSVRAPRPRAGPKKISRNPLNFSHPASQVSRNAKRRTKNDRRQAAEQKTHCARTLAFFGLSDTGGDDDDDAFRNMIPQWASLAVRRRIVA